VADHTQPITLRYRPQPSAAMGDVDAAHPGDFLITNQLCDTNCQVDSLPVTIPVGASSVSFTIQSRDGANPNPPADQVGDEMTEPEEFWDLELFMLNDPDGYTDLEGGGATLRLTGLSILPSDGFAFSVGGTSHFVTEGDSVKIPIGLFTSSLDRQTLPDDTAVRLTFTLMPVTASGASDGDIKAPAPLSLLVTESNRDNLEVTVETTDDSTPERSGAISGGPNQYETFILSIASVEHAEGLFHITGQANQNAARIVIRDNDPIYFSVTATDAEISESPTGPGGNQASFQFSFADSRFDASVPARFSHTGTATPGMDFSAPQGAGSAFIPNSLRQSAEFTYTALADKVYDPDETLVITITSIESRLSSYLVAPHPDTGSVTVTITDTNAPAAQIAWDNLNDDGVLVLTDNISNTIGFTATIPSNTVNAALATTDACNIRQINTATGGAVAADAQLSANLAAAAGLSPTPTGTAPNHACEVSFTAVNLVQAHNTGTFLRARVTTMAAGLSNTVAESVVPVELRDGGLPTADAGEDVIIDEGGAFSLSGNAADARDDAGTTVTIAWSEGAVTDHALRPTGGELELFDWSAATVNTATLSGTATPAITAGGAVAFEVILTVTDPPGNTAQDTVTVTVVDPAEPVADLRLAIYPHLQTRVSSFTRMSAAFSVNAAGAPACWTTAGRRSRTWPAPRWRRTRPTA